MAVFSFAESAVVEWKERLRGGGEMLLRGERCGGLVEVLVKSDGDEVEIGRVRGRVNALVVDVSIIDVTKSIMCIGGGVWRVGSGLGLSLG